MGNSPPNPSVLSIRNVHFEPFDLDLTTRELRKHGVKLKLAEQPFRILTALLARPGALVTREELQQQLWPGETAGDFEQGLNRAMSKLRDTLNDRAASARYIETLPGRGYRFVGAIDAPPEHIEPRRRSSTQFAFVGIMVASLLVVTGFVYSLYLRPGLPQPNRLPQQWGELWAMRRAQLPSRLRNDTAKRS